MSDLIRAALLYLSLGWRVVPLPRRAKGPALAAWQTLKLTADEVHAAFAEDGNIGIILGNGLVDVDLDTLTAVRMADTFLPPTPAMWGRQTMPRSHRLYLVGDAAPSRTTFTDGSMLLEIRGDRHQSMAPPSVHPSGELVQWSGGGPGTPATVNFSLLDRRCRLLSAAVVLAERWPARGTRNDTALATAGLLLSIGCSVDETREVIGAVAQTVGTQEWRERAAAADATAEKLTNGEPVTGGPRLAELLGEDGETAVNRVREFLGADVFNQAGGSDLLLAMNTKYFVVRVGGKVIVGDESEPGDLVLMPRHEYVALDPTRLKSGDRKVAIGQWWLDQPGRRQYGRLVFLPPPRSTRKNDYNLWTGFATESQEGSWEVLRRHFLDVWCEGKEDRLAYVLDWYALLAQRPGTPAEIALVLRGGRGTGKSWPVRAIGHAWFGRHFAHVSSSGHLTGRFNAALSAKCLVFADEAFWAGDRSAERELKRLITEPTLTIERKGIDPVEEPNCVHLIIAGNDDHLVPAGVDERRFVVLDVSDARQNDRDYFRALAAEFDAGGAAAFLFDMQRRLFDLDRIKAGLQTDALAEQKLQSLDAVGKFWHDRLMAGVLLDSDGSWKIEVAAEALQEAYLNAAGRIGERRKATVTELGMKLRKYVPGLDKFRSSVNVAERSGMPAGSVFTARPYVYKFPSLEECRAAFDKVTRHSWDWPAADGTEGPPF